MIMHPPIPSNGLTDKISEIQNFVHTIKVRRIAARRSMVTLSIQQDPSDTLSPPNSNFQPV